MKRLQFVGLFLVLCSSVFGQNWTTYTNMNIVNEVVSASNRIYAATSGGILVINPTDLSYEKVTNADGVGGISILSAAWDGGNYLWFGSSNGKLSRYELSSQSWRIYDQFVDQNGLGMNLLDLFPDSNRVWVGHNQGLSLFDRDQNGGEIKETYQNFSGLSSPLSVQALLVWGNQIWVGTSRGIALADKNDFNLMDPSHWLGIDSASGRGLSSDFIKSLGLYLDTLWVGTRNGLFSYNPADTTLTDQGFSGIEIRDLEVFNGTLYLATSDGLYRHTTPGLWVKSVADTMLSLNLNSVTADQFGNLWVASGDRGLSVNRTSSWEQILVSGPPGNIFNDLFIDQSGRLWCCNHDAGGSLLDNQTWTLFQGFNARFMSVAVDPQGDAWFGTLGKGVLRRRGNTWKTYAINTPLGCPLAPVCTSPTFVAVFGVSVDEVGNRWFANRDACNGTALVCLLAGTDSTFVSFKENENLNGTILRSNSMPFCFASDGNVWMGYIDAGLDALYHNFTPSNKSDDSVASFPASDFAFGLVGSLAIDRNGQIWIGTSGGLYHYDPSTLTLTGVTLPLEFGPQINSIAVDERNRKWLGTNRGLVVLDAQGNFEEAFTTSNSLLADDFINKVAYNQSQGELWVGTQNGLSKLSLPLTAPAASLDLIYAFPNPFIISLGTEKVSFAKLPFGSKVGIYTPAGELVRQLDQSGEWDGRNMDGKLVASGVYLFLVSQEGKESFTGKIALVRK